MKILVTGGAGFIASHVVDHYLSLGHEVVVVDNLSTGLQENLNPRARFHRVDITDPALDDVFAAEKPEIVNHHAAHIDVRKSVEDPKYDASVNILGSINLIRSARNHGVRKIVYASTGGAVYGEPRYLPCDEQHPIRPLCPYGISKYTVELYLSQASATNGLRYTVLRYPNVYGPRQNPKGEAGVNSIFIRQMLRGIRPTLYGKGHECRDYVYVGDLVKASSLVLEKGDGEVFNLGSGKGYTVEDLFRILSGYIKFHEEPLRADLRPGEVERMILNAEKARNELGWRPETSLEEGLGKTVEFFRAHPEYLG